jgi:hypothetical protein
MSRKTPWLSLEGRQLQAAFAHEGPLPPSFTPLEGPTATAKHAHVSLEGPQAADRRRPHISTHGLTLEGGAPLRAALHSRQRLKGKPHDLIQRARISAALVSTTNGRK